MNPRAAVNDLHPFQGCPLGQLGYFSVSSTTAQIIHLPMRLCCWHRKRILSNSFQTVFPPSGEDGIRTHVPLRPNGFQDRLVMTTSIPLRMLFSRCLTQRKTYITILRRLCQQLNSLFLQFFLQFSKKASAMRKSPGVVTFIFSYFP